MDLDDLTRDLKRQLSSGENMSKVGCVQYVGACIVVIIVPSLSTGRQ